MNSNTRATIMQLLTFGAILAGLKIVYMFFDAYNIADFIVFLLAGILLGGKVPANRKLWGLFLSLPALALCMLFILNLGYKSIMNGIGTSYAVSFIVIPVATMLGIFIHSIRGLRKTQ